MREPIRGRFRLARIGLDAGQESEHYTGHRRVHSRLVREVPGDDRDRNVEPRGSPPEALGEAVGNEHHERRDEPRKRELVRVEESDDGDGAEIVHDGEGEKECSKCNRQFASEDRENGEGERDIGGHRNAPALGGAAVHGGVDGEVKQCGNDHPAKCGNRGYRRL